VESVTWDFDTPEHTDWPACTEYPGGGGIHHDHELARDEPEGGEDGGHALRTRLATLPALAVRPVRALCPDPGLERRAGA
jgi:hypothetical protein